MPAIPIVPPVPMPNRKGFDCTKCAHYQQGSGATPFGQCRAHPPRHCVDNPQAVNLWPVMNPSNEMWCDEFKRATPNMVQTDSGNAHNPDLEPFGMGCASCDHFQSAPTVSSPYLGICLAHAPVGTCTADGADREANAFPQTDGGVVPWCSEYKRSTSFGTRI